MCAKRAADPDSAASPLADKPESEQGTLMQGRTAVFGVSVTLAAYLGSRIMNLVVIVLLSRVLGPSGMGVIAFAMLTVEIFNILRDFGLKDTLIYDQESDDRLREAAFFSIFLLGLFQALVLAAAAPLAGGLIDDPVIVPVLMWLALLFPINAVTAVQEAILQREFQFGRLALAEIGAVVVKATVTIALIALGAGVWSFVSGLLLGSALRAGALWLLSDWRPRRVQVQLHKLREFIRYGRHIMATTLGSALGDRLDQIIIVAVMGETALGLYFVAARVPEILVTGVNTVLGKIVFPAFSRMSEDTVRLSAAYRTVVAGSMMLMAPISLGLAAVSPLLVPVVFGDAYVEAVPVLAFLAALGVPVSLAWASGDFFKATGRPSYLWKLMALEAVFMFPLVYAAARFGGEIWLVAAAMFVAACLASGLRILVFSRVSRFPVACTIGPAWRPVFCAVVMAACVYTFIVLAGDDFSRSLTLLLAISGGALVYVALLLLLDGKTLRDWLVMIRRVEGS